MWNRLSGKSDQSKDDSPSQKRRRNDEEQRHSARRSGSIASSSSYKGVPTQADDRDPRGFDLTSVSYSSATRAQHPGAASASRAPSYAITSRNNNGEPCMAPDLVGHVSLADQMPRSNALRSSRDQDQAREGENKKRDKPERSDNHNYDVEKQQKRNKRDKKDKKDTGLKKPEKGLDEELGTDRGPDDFHHQVANSGFSQFPDQYDGAIQGPNGAAHEHPALSSHVQDQFPGQFPTQSSAPYRPPLAASEGGPGLAAEYYGDDGQSVAEQPGNRTNTPSLIIGAEPHLQPALAVAAPPPEPSASGAVGAAASFFSGEFEENEVASTHGQQSSSTIISGQIRPNSNHQSSSTPVISTLGGTAIGSVAGYLLESQTLSHQQRPDHQPSIGGASSHHSSIATHRPPSEMQHLQHYSSSQPAQPGKLPFQSSSAPIYAAGVAGTAGLAAATYELDHHSSNQEFLAASQYSTTTMSQRHRNRGPLSAFIDFFRDPEGVAQFEEYSQIIGVCRHCFAPGSSPRDAPRKHFYGRRRSNERYASSTRVDKDYRYHSSENENRRKNKSWLAADLAGYGLGNIGESTLHQKDESNDTHNVRSGRLSPDRKDRKARRRSRSKERVGIGIVDVGRSDKKDSHEMSNSTKTTTRRHSRTRSRLKDQQIGVTEGVIGAALGASVIASSSRRQSHSAQGTPIKTKHLTQVSSPETRHSTKKKKKDRGFFSFVNGSSSSSSVDLAYTGSQNKHRSSRKSTSKSKDDKKAEAALLGLGVAAAALGLNDGGPSHRKKGVRELVGVKETKERDRHGSVQTHTSEKTSGKQDDELWESAAEDDYENMNSDLAYGAPIRRDSRASLSSESSGTNKWGWRWGSKKSRKPSSPQRKSSDHSSFPTGDSETGASLKGAALTSPVLRQGSVVTSTSSLPLQHVHPVPTSDPSRFDVGLEEPIAPSDRPAISSRPEAIPLQHPRPIAPVSAAIYSSQTAYDHSDSAPASIATLSQIPFHHHPGPIDARQSTQATSVVSRLPRIEQQADDKACDATIQRRDTSPTTYKAGSISNSVTSRRRNSTKDDSSTVRFDLTEEQEKRDRRERRRKRKKDKERCEAEEQNPRHVSREEVFEEQGSKTRPETGLEKSEDSWVGPAAAGVIGAVIGSAAATKSSRSEETREQRRERRRRERELEDEENDLNKSERRRRQRERKDQDVAIQEHGRQSDEVPASSKYVNYQGRSLKKGDMSVWQEAASTKQSSSHENYGAFFTPLELLNKSSDQVKVTSANADADVDIDQIPQIVTVEPERIHDLSNSPAFSFADDDERVDPSKPSFPWKVPRLRLVEPTPPSTRGSTPIPQSETAGEEGSEGPRKGRSPSKVKWADDQSRDHTNIASKEDHDESFEPPSDPVGFSRDTDERNTSNDQTLPQNDPMMGESSALYGNDVVFAATLAAGAEDAGFDPSIVINNPAYRRRDSPPGSNKRSMPGRFDDEAEPRLKNKERKRKDRFSEHQSQNDGLNERVDDAIVQDIISQVGESESQLSDQFRLASLDDRRKCAENIERLTSKKESKGSDFGDKFFETSEMSPEALNPQKRDVYESTAEDPRLILSTSNETEDGKESRKESTRDKTDFEEAVSTVSTVPSQSMTKTSDDPKHKLQNKRKGSMWERILGKSTGSLSHEKGAKDITEETDLEGFKRPERKSENFKERGYSHDSDNDSDNYDVPSSREQTNVGFTTPSARNGDIQDPPAEVCTTVPSVRSLLQASLISSQDEGFNLPSSPTDAVSVAKRFDHGVELEQAEEKQPQSFLEMGPEPPPPPDTRVENEQDIALLEITSLPSSPCAEPETQGRRFSDAEIFSPTETTAHHPPSPTAVPFRFRLPGRSSSTSRSLSQTPMSSDKSTADLSLKYKTRPRSMEFESSKEIRPLWPVERHRSHQEPTLDEIYPSLPSSHTTSRNSSIHDADERKHHQNYDDELNQTQPCPIEVEPAPEISTGGHSIDSEILDPQQVTPAASFSQPSRIVQDLPSPQAYGGSLLSVSAEEHPEQSSSTLKDRNPVAAPGDYTAVPLNESTQNNDLQRQDLSREENDGLGRRPDDKAPDTLTYPPHNDTLDEEVFVPQRDKKAKKTKRRTNQSPQETSQPSLAGAAESKPTMSAVNSEPLSTEFMRQIQEQDAQDAVDSWSPSVFPSTKRKKSKKSKGRAPVEKFQEESGPPPNTHESGRDNFKDSVSAEGHGSNSLTQEMSRRQVVDTMTAAAQDPNVLRNEASQYATVSEEHRREPNSKHDNKGEKSLPQDDLQQDDLQTKAFPTDDIMQEGLPQDDLQIKPLPRDGLPQDYLHHDEPQVVDIQRKFDELDHASLPRDDLLQSQGPQDRSLQDDLRSESLPLLLSSAPTTANFGETFLEKDHTSMLESPKVNPTSQDFNRGGLATAISPELELSPRAIPIPDGDDGHHLLDEQLRSPSRTSSDHFVFKEKDTAAERIGDFPHAHDPSAYNSGPQGQSQDHPSSGEQVEEGMCSGALSKDNLEKDEKPEQSFSEEGLETTEEHRNDKPLPGTFAPTKLEDDWAKSSNEEAALEVDKSGAVEDEMQEITSREKGKEEQKAKPSSSNENIETTEVQGQQYPPRMAASDVFEDDKAMQLTNESAVDVSRPKAGPLENDRTGFDNKKMVKLVEEQESETFHLESRQDEIDHQLEQQLDARDNLKNRHPSLATTQTSQEVSAMLGIGDSETSVIGESKEASRSEPHEERVLQKSSKDQISGRGKQGIPTLDELKTPQFADALEKAQTYERFPTVGTSVPDRAVAQDAQEVYARENNAIAAADAKTEAIAVSKRVEETNNDIPINEDEFRWDVPKKKKKGKKERKSEAFPEESPERTGRAESLAPSDVMDAPLEQDPAAARSIEEDELDRDAPKKKKKGKKGKKDEVVSLGEPVVLEPGDVYFPPATLSHPPLGQELMAKADDELLSKQSKKDKKGKKGKRKGVPRATSGFQDEDERNVILAKVPQDEDNAEDLPVTVNDNNEGMEPASAILPKVPQDGEKEKNLSANTSDSRKEYEHGAVRPEELNNDDRVEYGSLVDRSLVTRDVREDVEPDSVQIEALLDQDNVEKHAAVRVPAIRTEGDTLGEISEQPLSTGSAQDDRNETFQEAPLEQEQHFMPLKGKKDKKKSKKSKKFSTFLPDDGESPTLGDRQRSGTQDLQKDEPAETFRSSVEVIEESNKPSPETRSEQEEGFLPSPEKKDKKKSKKVNAFSLERDSLPTHEIGPAPESKDLEKESSEQTLPSSVGVVKKSEIFGQGLSKGKKDRETAEVQRFEWKGEDANTPSKSETAEELSKESKFDNNICPPEFSGIMDHEHEESIPGDLDSISAHAATPVILHGITSSVTSYPEQSAGLSEETPASRADVMQDNRIPAVAADMESPFSLKASRKDQKQAKKTRQLSAEEVALEPKATPNEFSALEDTGEPSTNPVIQDSESHSKTERYNQGIEPKKIVEPDIESEKNRGNQADILGETPSQAKPDSQYNVEADEEDRFANDNKDKWRERTSGAKLSTSEPDEDRSHVDSKESAWAKAIDPVEPYEQTSEQQPRDIMSIPGAIRSKQENSEVESNQEQDPILPEPRMINKAKDEDIPWDVSAHMAEKPEKQRDEVQPHELEIEDLSSSAAPEPALETVDASPNKETFTDVEPARILDNNEPIPTTKVTMLDTQEQSGYKEEYTREIERAVPNAEFVADIQPFGGPDIDKLAPELKVEMLDAQEQREYNEEYTKELERQLSPLEKGDAANPSLDKANTAVFPTSGMNSVLERPYEEEHRPLARPPTLEDITEESISRSGSVQGSPADRKDEHPPIRSSKKGKKGKKGKKRQPVIWEDETATPPLELESGQGAARSGGSSEGPSSWNIDAAQPLDLDEHVEHMSPEDRTIASPIGDLNTAYKKSAVENDRSGDYFAIQPSRLAEEDVGAEDAQEFRRALETEPPYSSKSRSLAQSPQADQDHYLSDDAIKADIRNEEVGALAADFHVDPTVEAEPAREQVEDDFDHTPFKSTKLGTRAEEKASAREPDSQAIEQEDAVDQLQDPQTPTRYNLIERSPPRQRSLQRSSGENELSLPDEGKSTRSSESGNIEEVTGAANLSMGALAAESLSRSNPKREGRLGKKVKGTGMWTDFEAETGEEIDNIDRDIAVEEREHRQTLESESAKRASQHRETTPPRSPPSADHEALVDHPVVGSLGNTSESPEYRDSAIYVSGSPLISEEIPYHRAVRDSGYPDTEVSPTNDNKPAYLDAPTDSGRGITPGENLDGDHETYKRQRSMSRDPLEISIEADSDYDVSVTRPRERRKGSRRRSGVAYDSDDSADSGFDVQRRRRRQAIAAGPREPSPVSSTTKDRSSALFDSSPSARHEGAVKSPDQDLSRRYGPSGEKPTWSFDREGIPQEEVQETSRAGRSDSIPEGAPELISHSVSTGHREATGMSMFGGPQDHEDGILSPSRSPHSSESRGRQRLNTISEDSADGSQLHKKDKRAMSDVGSPESGVKGRRMRSPPVENDVVGEYVSPHDPISREAWSIARRDKGAIEERSRSRNSDQLSALSSRRSTLPGIASGHGEGEYRTASAASMNSENSIHAIIRTPDQVRSASGLSYRSSGTPPLRRVDRSASGDLRGASKKDQAKNHAKNKSQFEAESHIGLPSSSTYDPVTDKGKSPADMADIYEGWGDVHGQSPMSPTRPPSMRKRQSMQILDLETRLDQIISENRLMASQKLTAERALQEQARDHSQERHAYEEAIQEHKTYLTRKDSEVSELKKIIEQLHDQAAHLTKEVNEGLASSRGVDEEHEQRYRQLHAEHAHTHEQWQQSTRELDNLKEQHTQLSTGMEDLVRHEVTVALEEKDLELRQLQSELGNAKQQVRNLQQQLLASRSSDDFVERDEDYFDSRCQSLCQHVQQWVLRFSKFSDMKPCYLAREIHDEKVVDRMENAILDGSDVDEYLSDRVKRRDVFMSVVMTMIWEFIFTRYLFGMDREQRQKLKNLEKTLQEVGPTSAVHKWRATTLTLLMKRETFENQRATDTEAVIHEIFDTLATFLPPPTHLVGQIQDSLRKVIDAAVDLSIEMRTQRAEYSMLPPLQPEYDTNGDLARKVYFSALTMNERSGATSSNEALQEQQAVVRMVLFPLVVKNEDDDEQIVVCPAQVLTAEGSKGKKTVRVLSAQGWRSEASFAGSDVRMEGGMI